MRPGDQGERMADRRVRGEVLAAVAEAVDARGSVIEPVTVTDLLPARAA